MGSAAMGAGKPAGTWWFKNIQKPVRIWAKSVYNCLAAYAPLIFFSSLCAASTQILRAIGARSLQSFARHRRRFCARSAQIFGRKKKSSMRERLNNYIHQMARILTGFWTFKNHHVPARLKTTKSQPSTVTLTRKNHKKSFKISLKTLLFLDLLFGLWAS